MDNTQIFKDEETTIGTGLASKVILYNDEVHSFDDVANQLIKAIACSSRQAYYHAFNVDKYGQETVFLGDMDKAIKVSSILEAINLKTEITT